MAISTVTAARDEILTHFRTLWIADAATAGIDVYYDDFAGNDDDALPDTWIKVNVKHTLAGQRTMAEAGNRRFSRFGLFTVQIFTPAGVGQIQSDVLTQIVVDIFEGKKTAAEGAWFRNVRFEEVGHDRRWFQVNVIAEFEYDAIK